MRIGGLPVETDVSAGAWIAEALASGRGVAAVVPAVFPAYARVLHPAYRYDRDDDVEVTWAEVAGANGRRAHGLMQWPSITGGWEYVNEDSQPPTWDGAPAEGHLPVDVAQRMVPVLGAHTGTPGDCWFGRWAGFGYDASALAGAPQLRLPGARDAVLVRGAVGDAVRNLAPEPHEQSANLWWPADRGWCVATDIDLMSTYVGSSAACVAALLATPGVEAWPAAPGDPVGFDSDRINPAPGAGS